MSRAYTVADADPPPLAPLTYYQSRYRGIRRRDGVFAIYSNSGGDVLHVDLLQYRSPQLFVASLREEGRITGRYYCAGLLSPAKCDIILLGEMSLDEIPIVFLRLITTLAAERRDIFDDYMDAQILVRRAPSEFGTIRAIVDAQRSSLH
jgi:hypothetical protein